MTIYTDNRGYSYIGSQKIGATEDEVYGDRQHSSSVNGALTSEIGMALQAQVGNGKWAVASSPTVWTSDINSSSWADLLWTPASITKAGAPIDILSYTSSTSTLTDTNGDSYVFGVKLKGSSGRNVINTDGGGNLIQVGAGFFYNHTTLNRNLYISVTPESVGIFAIQGARNNPRFWYSCTLQGGNLADPLNRFTMYRDNSTTNGSRPLLAGSTTGQSQNIDSAVYSDTLATASNTTGDPYITRWYPTDNGGATTGLSAGYAPELYLLHDNTGVVIGDVINTADLDGGGMYNNGSFDSSNFTYLIAVRVLSSTRMLMMRIGTDTGTL